MKESTRKQRAYIGGIVAERDALRAVNAELAGALEFILPVLDTAHDNASNVCGRHMRELGTSTPKNQHTADLNVADLKAVEVAQEQARAALANARSRT